MALIPCFLLLRQPEVVGVVVLTQVTTLTLVKMAVLGEALPLVVFLFLEGRVIHRQPLHHKAIMAGVITEHRLITVVAVVALVLLVLLVGMLGMAPVGMEQHLLFLGQAQPTLVEAVLGTGLFLLLFQEAQEEEGTEALHQA
jgi:hypothetical protein